MEDLLKKQFEAQFGDEWSAPVVKSKPELSESESESDAQVQVESVSEIESENDEPTGPLTVRHTELHNLSNHMQHRRQFMSSKAPREAEAPTAPKTKQDELDLKDDLELQRLISESHILDAHKGYSGADISYGDPMEHIGKSRLAIMQQRLEGAGGKKLKQNTPMKVAKGIKAKQKQRDTARRTDAQENGIILEKKAKDRKVRVHDKGLKINSIGKATAHGIELSARDISRVSKSSRGRGRGRGRGGRR